jgi:RNA-directed DNA polymerase
MGVPRRKNQMELAFMTEGGSEAPCPAKEGVDRPMAAVASESPASTEPSIMEEITSYENMTSALHRVRQNKGSPGVDGMTVENLLDYLKTHWPSIRDQLREGAYRPQPVKRVTIPKLEGCERMLGIPTVLDRLIQQAGQQVLSPQWDPTFSEASYGFRPGRSAHQAVAGAQRYIAEGYGWVVDLDLEKFFDRVNHDRLMAKVAERVKDKRLLKLIRAYLNAGMMADGLVSFMGEGVPQGSPLSPLLSNLVLDELDRELENRGHRFVRYADDCNIYVRSERAGRRVMEGVSRFIHRTLRLRVNVSKSAVARPRDRKFLGFSFTGGRTPKRRIAPKALSRFKERVRELTGRNRGIGVVKMVEKLNVYLRGWRGYFGQCQTPSVLDDLNSWIRRRLRGLIWRQWKRGRTRFKELTQRGVGRDLAAQTAGSAHGPWRISASPALSFAFPNAWFVSLGLITLTCSQPA